MSSREDAQAFELWMSSDKTNKTTRTVKNGFMANYLLGPHYTGHKAFCQETAPAKLNLTLHIEGKRDDGYHTINSLMVFTNWGDTITLAPLYSGQEGLSLTAEGEFAHHMPRDMNQNLIIKAIRAVDPHMCLSIHIQKNIPAGAGLGGGSADAAAILRLLHHGDKMSREDMERVAISLGSDVLACLNTRPCMITGRGENVQSVENLALPRFVVIVYPNIPLLSARVYHLYDMAPTHLPMNDLEEAACREVPEIRQVIKALYKTTGCMSARMSGSGSACFGLYAQETEAQTAQKLLSKTFPNWWVHTCEVLE